MRHLYKNSGNYYLLDTDYMKFYKVPNLNNEKLDTYSSDELKKIAEKLHLPEAKEEDMHLLKGDKEKCNRLILNLSDKCNLACKYCYAEEGSYGQSTTAGNMSIDTLKRVVRRTLELYPHGIGQIQFFGGEPLLNKNVLYEAVKWIKEYAESLSIPSPIFTIVTNGTLIDEECISVFNAYFSSVTISLDGKKEVNDNKRIFRGKENSVFDKVLDTIERMNIKKRNFHLCIEGTIHEEHIKEYEKKKIIESYQILHNLEVDMIHISPLITDSQEKINYCVFF